MSVWCSDSLAGEVGFHRSIPLLRGGATVRYSRVMRNTAAAPDWVCCLLLAESNISPAQLVLSPH